MCTRTVAPGAVSYDAADTLTCVRPAANLGVQGDHCFLPGGNARLVAALAEGIPIFYGNAVKRISYQPQGGVAVMVKGDTVYKADACLCTVPLGVLKVRLPLPGAQAPALQINSHV